MCGLVGILDLKGRREINRTLLNKMNETQFHRGPDEGGLHLEPGVGLGHRRLSIIDLSSGQQPLFNEDGTVVVVYNGEIYNFQELADELKTKGHIFRTHCDTEVIVHAWEEWGKACVKKFRGMFAFALWDRNRSELFLARDRLGIKPLYYAELPNGFFIFGSELKAIMAHPNVEKEIDNYAVEDYFALGYVPEPKTIFKSVRKLEPGYTLLLKKNLAVPKAEQYWDIPFQAVGVNDFDSDQEELLARLKEAVNIRLVSDVPLGAFLSGGVDSSAVVSQMALLSPDERVNTCSIGFGDPKYNEIEYAELVAKQYNTNHKVKQVDPDDYELLDFLSNMYDEPFADSSSIPTYRVCELAKKYVTVALSGDGGDENLAGYRRHRWHMLEESVRGKVPGLLRKPVFGLLGRFYPKMDWAPKIFRAKTTFQAIAQDSIEAYLNSVSVTSNALRDQLFSVNFKKELAGYNATEVFHHHAKRSPTDHPLSLIQYIDMKTYLPGDILTKVDRASMATSLEVRVPLLDHKFVEWVSGLSPDVKLRGREGKYIFKRALEKYLPNEVLYRSKMGFAVPLAGWFRGPLREKARTAILGDQLSDSGVFDTGFLKRVIDEHQSGMREHSAIIWSLLMFEAFMRRELS
jgi:asparagine synthase (glutamine-hydrolysing)